MLRASLLLFVSSKTDRKVCIREHNIYIRRNTPVDAEGVTLVVCFL